MLEAGVSVTERLSAVIPEASLVSRNDVILSRCFSQVEQTESLRCVAARHDTTVTKLKSLNKLMGTHVFRDQVRTTCTYRYHRPHL